MANNGKQLNKEQEAAARHVDGPMLVVAGAGTGKTTILVERLKYLVETNKARGDEILLLTFTEKGAGEMHDRALKVLPYGYFDLWISTFHGFCERLLREHALDIGLNPDFKLLGTTEQWVIIKKNLDRFKLDYYKPLGNPTKFIYEMVKHFSRLKDENIMPQEYIGYAEKLTVDRNGDDIEAQEEEIWRVSELAHAYKTYQDLLLEKGYLDFGDLITYSLSLFGKRPAILDFYRKKFKFIMIDEFQDTNWSQYELVKILALPKNNLLVVGDDDQSIYKFRGASLSNILQFKDDYPLAKETVLTSNYRSGQKILDTAYDFIQHNNPNRLEERIKINKKLIAASGAEGVVEHIIFSSALEEENWVAEEILRQKELDQTLRWSDFAILVRANSSADDYVAELKRKNIPNVFVSLRGLYYKSIVIDCIAYLKLLDHYHESSALFRVLNMEVFKVEHADLVNITRYARNKAWSLYEALKNLPQIEDISEKSRHNINFLLKLISDHSLLSQKEVTSKIFVRFVHDAGLDKKDYHENLEYFSYLNQFYTRIIDFEKDIPGAMLKDFLELLEMELEAGETGALRQVMDDADKVNVMTVHSSKGLEFRQVFIVNMVDRKFPSTSRKDKIGLPDALVHEKSVDTKNAHIEEERRLFYVAVTRAKERLILTGAKDYGGARDKKPSIFIEESKVATKDRSEKITEGNVLLRDVGHLDSPMLYETREIDIPDRFSFSQVEAFANCPLQYKFNFILRIPVLSKPVLSFGRVMHNTLKEVMSGLIESAQPSLFEINDPAQDKRDLPDLDMIMAAFHRYWHEDGYEDKEQREQYKQLAIEMLKLFYKRMSEEGWPRVAYVEKAFVYKLNEYFFKGSIDRIDRLPDGTYEIVDYKTGTPHDKLTFQNKRQLILYKMALEDGLNAKVSRLTFFYLKDGTSQSFESKPKDEEKLKEEILEVIAEIMQGKFPPKPGFLCDYCDFARICEFKQVN